MSQVVWRWEEKDLGFRFRTRRGRATAEYYQARRTGEFYLVPAQQRKLPRKQIDALAAAAEEPPAVRIVASPWRNYERDWDWVVSDDGVCLNWAGCLDRDEIHRREDEGVQRALEVVAALVERPEPVPITVHLLQQMHAELMGAIYPFAGQWRTVELHKGEGPVRWPLPPGGIQPLMDVFERDVLSRSPLIADDDQLVFAYASEVMNELLAIHPFREGNGRTAFSVGNLILMQNDLLPLTSYERRTDEDRYLEACEAGRIYRDYQPLTKLLAEWESRALARWRARHG